MKGNISRKDFNNLKKSIREGQENFIGFISVGSLKFDLVYREINPREFELNVDLYYISDDTSYGITKDGRGYDFLEGFTISNSELKRIKGFFKFKRIINKEISKLIKNSPEDIKKQFNKDLDDWKISF